MTTTTIERKRAATDELFATKRQIADLQEKLANAVAMKAVSPSTVARIQKELGVLRTRRDEIERLQAEARSTERADAERARRERGSQALVDAETTIDTTRTESIRLQRERFDVIVRTAKKVVALSTRIREADVAGTTAFAEANRAMGVSVAEAGRYEPPGLIAILGHEQRDAAIALGDLVQRLELFARSAPTLAEPSESPQ